jgi:hypothetical protein
VQGLYITKGCLLYALGYRDELRNEGFSKDRWSDDDIDNFMRMAFSQPGRLQMPARPQVEVGSSITYRTKVLGCQITVEAPANADAISAAEAVLGTIEAFFATSLGERIMPYRSAAKIVVGPAADLAEGLRIAQVDSDGGPFLRVQYPASAPSSTPEARKKYRDGLMALVAYFISYVAVVEDFDAYLDRIGGEERGFARALLYAEVSLAQDNVFGPAPKVLIRDWKLPTDAGRFPLNRATEWSEGVEIKQLPLPGEDEPEPKPGDRSDPRSLFKKKSESETHADRKIMSHIDIPLWNAAKWRAVFYFADFSRAPLPVLCLGFAEKESAAKIFQGWQKQFGAHDRDNKIRVTILKGIHRNNPAAYRVFVSSNVEPEVISDSLVVLVGRHQTMTPSTTANLDGFLKIIEETKSYLLAPAHFISETKFPDIDLGLSIRKDELVVRQAWEVGPNDIDATAFLADDDPVIPPYVQNPPVKELLELMKGFQRRRN